MFKFSFGEETVNNAPKAPQSGGGACEIHQLELIRKDLPRISYMMFDLNRELVPRRDFFDVKYQLMAKDEPTEQEKILLGNEDVRKNVYEGGIKVWEGALDLVRELESFTEDKFDVLELGCGAAVPLCYLLYRAFKLNKPGRFVFADFNEAVLTLVTIPNCVLAWLAATQPEKLDQQKGEINLSADLIDEFELALKNAGITLSFVSGSWSEMFTEKSGGQYKLVLASETIYSLENLDDFCGVLHRALGERALVAAKKVYFGVGGSVVEFERKLEQLGLAFKTINSLGDVGRVIIEVTR